MAKVMNMETRVCAIIEAEVRLLVDKIEAEELRACQGRISARVRSESAGIVARVTAMFHADIQATEVCVRFREQ